MNASTDTQMPCDGDEVRGIKAMNFSKLLRCLPLSGFVLCVSALLGLSTGPLLADGTIAPRSFQSGGVAAFENGFRRAQVVVQACKPSGAACSLPGECCSNSCVPPGFGGEPTCR
jgi:hypothetical protein